MASDRLREQIRDQFSDRGSHADIWKVLDMVTNTREFLNLGYSPWYLPSFVGSSQRRLARKIGVDLRARLPATDKVRLLDIGCGRGGPSIFFVQSLGFDVTGVDLVPSNLAVARGNAVSREVPVGFIGGDATYLPIKPNSFDVCTALDSIVYIPEKRAAFDEMANVLQDGGLIALSDLARCEGLSETQVTVVDEFADAWDMPPLVPPEQYRRIVEHAGFTQIDIHNISPHSVARLRKWTALYLRLVGDGVCKPVDYFAHRSGLDIATITQQIRYGHKALPYLQHLTIYARKE